MDLLSLDVKYHNISLIKIFLEHRVEKGLGDLLTSQCLGWHHIHRLSGAQGREGLWRLVDLAVPGQAPHTGFLEHRVEKGYRRPTYSRCGMTPSF